RAALVEGRDSAERLLLKDRHGRHCARRLCAMHDEIIRVLFEFAGKHLYPSDNPSEAERMAVVATGGYGRGLLAPGSDIDLLFLLPYKQTAWGESIAEAILYCLWDMGPNVKDGKGGLRDLHTLFWIAKYVYRVREPEELIEKRVFDRREYMLFRRCEDFLWSVRCHMHFLAGRPEERLSFDIQREIAVRL